MTVLAPLPPDDGSYELVLMLTPSRAVELYLGDDPSGKERGE